MMNFLKPLCSPRIRISALLTVSILAILLCCINLPIVYVGLFEFIALAGCIALFRKVDVTQYDLFQYKPHWIWRICEWYWSLWFCFNTLPFIQWLGNCYPTLKYAYFVYPSIFKPITDFAISNFGKVIAVRNLSTIMLSPIIILTMPIIYYCFRWLFKQVADFFQSFTKFEKYFFAISSTVLIAILFIVSSKTSYFIYPINKEIFIKDSSSMVLTNCYDENTFFNADILNFFFEPRFDSKADSFRHPGFSIAFSLFMPIISVMSFLCHFVYSSSIYSFATGTAISQIILYLFSGIMLKRIYSSIINQFEIILLVIYVCSYPVIFVFIPERLIYSTFFIVAAIYAIIQCSGSLITVILSLLASFSTLLSAFPIMFLLAIYKRWRQLALITVCLGITLIGRGLLFTQPEKGISRALTFVSDKTKLHNLICYNQLVTSNIVIPAWESELKTISYIDNENVKSFSSIWITQNENITFHVFLGCIIIIFCMLSFLFYFKHTIIQASFFWLMMSFLIVGVIGFGYDCSVLYCSYFSWAFIPLALLPFYWLWQKFPRLPIPQALYLFAAYLAISNLYFIYQVVQLVSDRYIVPPGM